MAYSSTKGRKPAERASKISQSQVINNPAVKELLSECVVPQPADESLVKEKADSVPDPDYDRIEYVIAVDGGYSEATVRPEFPAASVTFFTFGPLLMKLEDVRDLDEQPFLAPEDMLRLKNIQRYSLALPTANISRNGHSLRLSVRTTLHDFLASTKEGDEPLATALRWVLERRWRENTTETWEIPNCPNDGCTATDLPLGATDSWTCEVCGGPVFLVDALRLHERVDQEQGAAAISGYVMTTLEQVVLAHVIKTAYEIQPALLTKILFIKDGPLGFFGMTAPLSEPFRDLTQFFDPAPDAPPTDPVLNVAGLEKSGAFVEHAEQIADRLPSGMALILDNDYIYRYIIPGDPNSPDPYGRNTYWGGKLIYKASDDNIYVVTAPTGAFTPTPAYDDFQNLSEILKVLSTLKCSMYENALVPVALANKLVSLSEFPSSQILARFAREAVA
jgi:hypothetical protein